MTSNYAGLLYLAWIVDRSKPDAYKCPPESAHRCLFCAADEAARKKEQEKEKPLRKVA